MSKFLDDLGHAPPYQPIDGVDRPALQPCEERMRMMLDHLGPRVGSLVDVGCHTGWFCRRFAELGWEVLGIDRSRLWLGVAMELGKDDPNQTYVLGDVDDALAEAGGFDVALCLSVVMYWFGDRDGWSTLRRVSEVAPTMFLDFGGQYSPSVPFSEEDAEDQIIARTRYSRSTFIGRTDFEARPFYAFER